MNRRNNQHIPVLLNEVVAAMQIQPNGIYVDCTAGLGGHSQALLNKLGSEGKLICIDQDKNSIQSIKQLFAGDQRVKIIHDDFISIQHVLDDLKIKKVDGILLDLGVSSPMFDDPKRGFSYHHEGKLDMRMNQNQKLDAWLILNKYDAKQLNFIFKYYGEIRKCKKVTDAIINFRKKHEINTTTQLVEIIKSALPPKQLHIKKHPARNYFQAIRIAVNDELNKLKLFLSKAFGLLNKYGRLVIITFHSLEDRIVKQAFIKKTTMRIPKEVPVLSEQIDYLLITKHPIIANQEEVTINHRARSAKLRAIERK